MLQKAHNYYTAETPLPLMATQRYPRNLLAIQIIKKKKKLNCK